MESNLEDAELLRRYADRRDEAAFAELVQRHLGLVYHAALRQCGGDAHRAEDVAQSVFTDLARKAGSLAGRPVLAGWLYTSTRYAAAQAVRTETRRQAREQEAHAMNEILSTAGAAPSAESAAEWERLRPVIDDALHALGDRDREAVLLRFFEGRAFREVGARLSLTEDAARMRVERALEKMRGTLAQRGVTSTTTALSLALAQQTAVAVPAGLAAIITGAAVTAAGGGGLAAIFMNLTALQIGLAAMILAAGGAGFATQAATNRALRSEIAEWRDEERSVARLRDENDTLERAAAEIATARVDRRELARLRGEVAVARAQVQSKPSVGPGPTLTALPPLAVGNEPVRILLPDADLDTALAALKALTGWQLTREGSLGRVTINLRMQGPTPKTQVVEMLRTALRDQGGIGLEPGPNGTVLVKRIPGR